MATKTGSEFIIKLDGLKLPAAVEAAIAKEIQSVVMREIARIDLKGDIHTHFPRKDWMGIWIRTQKIDKIPMLAVNEMQG